MDKPQWLQLSDASMWPTVHSAISWLSSRHDIEPQLAAVPYAAAVHLGTCLDVSQRANVDGRHAVAVALTRHCVEALTIVELGLRDAAFARSTIARWLEEKATHGDLRQILESQAWSEYGTGLWNEPWSEYFGNLARAVQPYAHYTPLLMGWQQAVPADTTPVAKADGGLLWVAQIGMKTYDPLKASRVTLLHSLVGWTLGRLLVNNGRPCAATAATLETLRRALGESEYLCGGKATWAQELWPHMFFADGGSRFGADHPESERTH